MKWRKLQTNLFIGLVLFVTNFITAEGIALECSYGTTGFISPIGSTYTCTARVLFDGTENVTTVYGIHETGKGHEDVGAIRFMSQNLQFFPTNIENFFPNLILIELHNNNITSISNRHLIPFPNLKLLSLNMNKISAIDGDLFSGLDSMKVIFFTNNNIRHVGHDLNLPNGDIRFTGNPCINQNAFTPDEVAELKFNLLRKCPPTISQIEHSLERRQNLLTQIDGQVQRLRNEQANLFSRMAYVEYMIGIGNQLEAKPIGRILIDTFRHKELN